VIHEAIQSLKQKSPTNGDEQFPPNWEIAFLIRQFPVTQNLRYTLWLPQHNLDKTLREELISNFILNNFLIAEF